MKKIALLSLFLLILTVLPCIAAGEQGQTTRTTASGDGNLNLTVPCVAFGGGYYSVGLDRDSDSAAPFGVDWKLTTVAYGQAASNCATLDATNLNISVPYIEIFGNALWLELDRYSNPADPANFYWVFKDADAAYLPEGPASTAPVLLLENKNTESDVAGILSTDQGDMVFLKDQDPATQKEYIKSIAMLRKNEVVSTFTFDAQGGLVSVEKAGAAKAILQATARRLAVASSSSSSVTDTLSMISEAIHNLQASLGDTNVFAGYKSLSTIVSNALDQYKAGGESTIEHFETSKNLTCVSDLATCAKNVTTSFKAAVTETPQPDVTDSEKITLEDVVVIPTEASCVADAKYWYDNSCHDTPQAPPSPSCDATHLNLCSASSDCLAAGGYWYSNSCHDTDLPPSCDATHLNLCTAFRTCLDAGGYWYNNICSGSPVTATSGKVTDILRDFPICSYESWLNPADFMGSMTCFTANRRQMIYLEFTGPTFRILFQTVPASSTPYSYMVHFAIMYDLLASRFFVEGPRALSVDMVGVPNPISIIENAMACGVGGNLVEWVDTWDLAAIASQLPTSQWGELLEAYRETTYPNATCQQYAASYLLPAGYSVAQKILNLGSVRCEEAWEHTDPQTGAWVSCD